MRTKRKLVVGVLPLFVMAGGVQAVDVSRAPFGTLSNGQAVELITISNSHGMKLRLMTLGASIPIGRDVRHASDEQIRFGKGFDHNWVISRTPSADVRLVAKIEDPVSGRVLEILSNQPGIQFYTGNFLDGGVVRKSGHAYRQGDAFVLEPQLFPDTPNQPKFGSARLEPGQTYLNKIIYRFSSLAR
jgi:galactose mutarotase-like enzyme